MTKGQINFKPIVIIKMTELIYVLKTSALLKEAHEHNWEGTHTLYMRYAAKWIVKRQKFIIYILSVLRFIISHQLRSLQTPQQWFKLTVDDMLVNNYEIDKLIKTPSFQYRFSKQNYNFWKHQFSKDSMYSPMIRSKEMIDIEMAINDSSSDLKPTYPSFHSIKDRFKRSFLNYRYSNWVRKLDYDPGNYATKYFNSQINQDLIDEFKLSSMWLNFINDDKIDFINCLSAITTGYLRNGEPCSYLKTQFIKNDERDFQNSNKFISKRKSFSPLTIIGSQILKFRANKNPMVPITTVSKPPHEMTDVDDPNEKESYIPIQILPLGQNDNILPLATLWDGELTPFYKPPTEPSKSECLNDENQFPF